MYILAGDDSLNYDENDDVRPRCRKRGARRHHILRAAQPSHDALRDKSCKRSDTEVKMQGQPVLSATRRRRESKARRAFPGIPQTAP